MVVRNLHVRCRLHTIAVLAFGIALAAHGTARDDDATIDVRAFELDNGLSILIAPDDTEPGRVAVGVFARVGAAADSALPELLAFTGRFLFQPGVEPNVEPDAAATEAIADRCRRIAEIDNAIHAHVTEHQFPRYYAGEIADPWDPAHDSDALEALRRQRAAAENELFDLVGFDPDAPTEPAFPRDASHVMPDAMGVVTEIATEEVGAWAERVRDRMATPPAAAFYIARRHAATMAAQRDQAERDPDRAVREAFEASYWRGPYPHDHRIERPGRIERIHFRDVQDFAAQHLQPENLVIVIVGDCDVNGAHQIIASHFSTLSSDRDHEPAPLPPLTAPAPSDPAHLHGAVAEFRIGGYADVTPYILSRYRTVPHGHPDRPALDVVAALLDGPDSRLRALLIDQHGVASSVTAAHRVYKRTGVLDVRAAVAEKGLPEQLEMGVLMEVDRLRRSPIDEDALSAARNRVVQSWQDSMNKPTSRAIRIGAWAALGDWQTINTYVARIEAVTAADVQRVAQQYLDPTGRASLVVHQPPDPAFLALTPQLQNQVRANLSRMLTGGTSLNELQLMLDRLRTQSANAPEDVRPALAYMIRRIEERIAELNQDDAEIDDE